MRNIGRYVDIGITHQFFQRESFSNKSIFHRGRFFTKSTIVIIIIYIIKKHTFQKEEEEERIKMKLARFGRKFSADKAVKSNKKIGGDRRKHKSVKYLKRKKEKMKNFRSRGRG